MKIDGLLSLQGMYDHAKLGVNYQNDFHEVLQKAKEKETVKPEMQKAAAMTAEEKAKEEKELRKAVEGFESYFIHQILKQARATIPTGGLLPESNDKSIYEDMLDEARAEEMTKVGGFGLSDALMKQLSKK